MLMLFELELGRQRQVRVTEPEGSLIPDDVFDGPERFAPLVPAYAARLDRYTRMPIAVAR
ncbi:hypothetical protein ACRQ5Q_27545 [Bradyrhizobium sp. PMVTL-01]|uniref:hypothetical protein n=1 Tax=Bradyrhizobium sp. PMVTL-01 TaxID=3434999 RepID=UPI003F71E383